MQYSVPITQTYALYDYFIKSKIMAEVAVIKNKEK